jgi:hypothetical protein
MPQGIPETPSNLTKTLPKPYQPAEAEISLFADFKDAAMHATRPAFFLKGATNFSSTERTE